MKILVATPFMSQHFDAGMFWVKALCNMNHSVVLWDYRLHPERLSSISNSNYELAIVFKGEGLDPRLLHTPRICYWPDDLGRTPGIEEVLRHYNKVFTPVRPTPDWMEWLPSGWDPSIHRDLKTERLVNTIYIGTANSDYKVKTITDISPTSVFGNRWVERGSSSNPPVYLRDLVGVSNQAKILIDVHQSPTVGLNRKMFEMMACGPTIVDRVPGVEEVLPGVWNLCSFNPEKVSEANLIISYFLSCPEARDDLWKRQRKAIEPYTYENCARRLLEWIK